MGCTQSQTAKQKEAIANAEKLGRDIGLLSENEDLDVRKICILMWKAKNLNTELVALLSDLVAAHADEQEIFDGIEFYLPQFAHLIINLEIDWETDALEHFAMMISQQSTHFALQFYFILIGAMEDFQPEDDFGMKNPTADPVKYIKCATLLHNVERSVVFGSPRSHEFEKMYQEGKLTKHELQELELADRKFCAAQISDNVASQTLEGELGYKRWVRKSKFSTKKWQRRKFRVQHRVLLCFRVTDNTLKRAIPLQHTTVVIKKHDKHKYYFELQEKKRDRVYKLYADTKEDFDKWTQTLKVQALAPPPTAPRLLDTDVLTENQIARYGFFRSEREFVRDLTDICEELRFVDRSIRKPELKKRLEKLDIPGCVYLPLCKSTDVWARVDKCITEKAHAFSTKERCPCLMTFDVKLAPENMDVANYLFQTLGLGSLDNMVKDTLFDSQGKPIDLETLSDEDWRNKFAESAAATVEKINIDEAITGDSKKALKTNKRASTSLSAMEGAANALKQSHLTSGTNIKKTGKKPRSLWDSELNTSSMNQSMNSTKSTIQRKMSERKKEKRKHHTEKALHLVKRITDSSNNSTGDSVSAGLIDNMDVQVNESPKSRMKPIESIDVKVDDGDNNDDDDDNIDRSMNVSRHEQHKDLSMLSNSPELEASYKVICKSNDDLRQEVFTMQLLQFLKDIWDEAGLDMYLHPYRILSTSQSTGMIEVIDNSDSFDGVKGDLNGARLIEYFKQNFKTPEELKQAKLNFTRSLAAYSMATYILGIKDRHNGNIMLKQDGGVAHIDFGFLFGMAPGKDKIPYTNFSFEKAAFKLVGEMAEVMDGEGSDLWNQYIDLMYEGLKVARKHAETIIVLVEIMGYKSNFPCFRQPSCYGVKNVVKQLKKRLLLNLNDQQLKKWVEKTTKNALNHNGTLFYEWFQLKTNKLHPMYQ